MKKLWDGHPFRVAGMLERRVFGKCPACPGEDCSAWLFATFPATPVPFGDIWGEYGEDVSFDFFLCTDCARVHGLMHCT